MQRFFLVLLLLVMGAAWATEPARPFAALQITPYGTQQFDLATGVTTLPEGGEIVDQETNAVLTGRFLRYHDASFIEISDAVITSPSGTITAQEAHLDLTTLVLQARGDVTFESPAVTLSADMLTAHLTSGIVIAEGNVEADEPVLQTGTLLLLLPERQALLVGPYAYRSGPLTLSTDAHDRYLALWWEEEGDETVFHASTEAQPELMEHLEPYLP